MPKLRSELSASDCFLIFQAVLWYAVVELGLRAFEFRALVDFLQQPRQLDKRAFREQSPSAQRTAYVVELVARLHPLHPSCLKKALALYALLRRKGYDVRLFIGAVKTNSAEGSELDCHAWVEHQGQVILGGRGRERYTALCSFDRLGYATLPEGQAVS